MNRIVIIQKGRGFQDFCITYRNGDMIKFGTGNTKRKSMEGANAKISFVQNPSSQFSRVEQNDNVFIFGTRNGGEERVFVKFVGCRHEGGVQKTCFIAV